MTISTSSTLISAALNKPLLHFIGVLSLCFSFSLSLAQVSNPEISPWDRPIDEDYLTAIEDIGELGKSDTVSTDLLTQLLITLAEENPEHKTYRDLLVKAKVRVEHISNNTPDVQSSLRIRPESIRFHSQDEEMVVFHLTFEVENLTDRPIHDFALMDNVVGDDGSYMYGSTGGEGYLNGKALAPGEVRSGLIFPVEMYFDEDDDPEGEYGTYACIRILKKGDPNRVELSLFDIATEDGWVLYPR